jgi:hypothetical protein
MVLVALFRSIVRATYPALRALGANAMSITRFGDPWYTCAPSGWSNAHNGPRRRSG